MSELLHNLERELAKLPADKQDEWVAHFLEELSSKASAPNGTTHDDAEGEWIGGRKPIQKEVSDALEKIAQLSKGNTLGDDVSLKGLINEGRRY